MGLQYIYIKNHRLTSTLKLLTSPKLAAGRAIVTNLIMLLFPWFALAGEQTAITPPSVLFAPLYAHIPLSPLFPDGKIWADARPKHAPETILQTYRQQKQWSDQALRTFVAAHFEFDGTHAKEHQPTPGLPLRAHIAELWPMLTRQATTVPPWSSLLPLPHDYIVPGGRFNETYYWDTYFTMLGFGPEQASLQQGMLENFAYLITKYGHIPNGNRSYYLSRSQPPFFFKMVELTHPQHPAKAFATWLPALKAEYRYWMKGADRLKPNQAFAHVVRLPDGSLLNRYWDARDVPRDEAYRADLHSMKKSNRPGPIVYRNLRAGAESGWDFSSRWLSDNQSVGTIRTTEIVPPDLNSLLFGLEDAIAQGCAEKHDEACAAHFRHQARARAHAMRRYLWNNKTGFYDDYLWTEQRRLGHITAASLYPLFFGVANQSEANHTACQTERSLLKPGGLVTTSITSGQQWDAPNGWAPLQWIAVQGLRKYGHHHLAETIAKRWLTTVSTVYANTGKLLEKYNVVTPSPGGGGEYQLQDGFGWTNGTAISLMQIYPDALIPTRPTSLAAEDQQHEQNACHFL